jgi:probable F420-dependent oxidoreductase
MFHEPFVLFGFLAAVAPLLEPVTGVLVLTQRQTALAAKQAAEVDILSGGRLRLGVGIGWNPVEYEALGVRFSRRGHRLEEQVELLRRLWTEPVLDFDGEFHRVNAAGINPLPIQRPIPVWFGATSEAGLRRAARLGDGYIAGNILSQGKDWADHVERLHDWLLKAGRDPVGFGLEALISAGTGSPQEVQEKVGRWETLGGSHASLFTMGSGLVGPEAQITRLRALAEALGISAG